MELEDEEEYQYDSRTPVGQLLKRVEKLMKRPVLDDQLSELLDKFRSYFLEQQEYLNNGICQVRFSETALFIQACSKVFVRKVDVYWDQVLSFHARLIEYDVEHARKTGTQVDRAVIDRLEERRNRNKRKKRFKVVESNEWLMEIENHKLDLNELTEPCEADQECVKVWEELYHVTKKYRRSHPLVREQQLKVIKFDRKVVDRDDFDVYDMNGEFIMKYSKMPGWRDMYDLIEYNNEGLLPDKDNAISGLKLKYFGRIEYLRDNCIPFDTPYEEYRDGWEKYKLRFFELEARKWQNRPLDTLEDLNRQYEYLAEMANEDDVPEIVMPCNHIPLPKLTQENVTENSTKIEVVNPNNISPNLELFVVLDRLPANEVNMKSRQDSGFYDEMPEDAIDDELNEISALDVPNDDSSQNLVNDDNRENQQVEVNSDHETCLSDHNYCITPVNVTPPSENKVTENKTNTNKATTVNMMTPFENFVQIIPRAREILKRKLMRADKEPTPPKVRKLSKKQLEKLSKSCIKPVKELKFEKFFSMNYHPQIGEGEIQPVDYESDEEDDDVPDSFDAGDCPERSGSPDAVPVVPETPAIEQTSENLAESGFIDANDSTLNESTTEAQVSTTQKELETEMLNKNFGDSQSEPSIEESRGDALDEKSASAARVQSWKDHIKPIIKGLKETDFDIHEYGSRIMDGMQINEEKPFKNIVKGKSSAEVVRLFISTLQLASTSNIEICGVTPGELANDTYKVKLLKTERYHEGLEEYQAPSREVVRERRKRMREKQNQKAYSSDDEPLMKTVRKSKQYTPREYHDEPSTSRSTSVNVPEKRRRSNSSNVFNQVLSPCSNHDTEDEGFNESFSSIASTSLSSSVSPTFRCYSTPKSESKALRIDIRQEPNILNFSL